MAAVAELTIAKIAATIAPLPLPLSFIIDIHVSAAGIVAEAFVYFLSYEVEIVGKADDIVINILKVHCTYFPKSGCRQSLYALEGYRPDIPSINPCCVQVLFPSF